MTQASSDETHGVDRELCRCDPPGHCAYYGVSGKSQALRRLALEVKKLLIKWLNRRGKRGALAWDTFGLMLKRYPLPRPRITVMMDG